MILDSIRLFGMATKDPNSDPPRHTSLNVDTTPLKMGIGTFISVILFVISVCVAVVTLGVQLATRSDVADHSHKPHRKEDGSLVSAPASIVSEVDQNSDAVKSLEHRVRSIEKSTDEIRTGMQFLIESEIIKSERDPRARRAMRKAADRIRKESPDKSRQLDGMGVE